MSQADLATAGLVFGVLLVGSAFALTGLSSFLGRAWRPLGWLPLGLLGLSAFVDSPRIMLTLAAFVSAIVFAAAGLRWVARHHWPLRLDPTLAFVAVTTAIVVPIVLTKMWFSFSEGNTAILAPLGAVVLVTVSLLVYQIHSNGRRT